MTHASQAADAEACALALRLAHDVGKHAARAAHNIVAGAAVPVAVADMLACDLYALGGEHASACFARLAAPLRTARHDDRLEHCAALLSEVDALESAVRARDAGALARAAQCALEVEALLLAVARAHCAEP